MAAGCAHNLQASRCFTLPPAAAGCESDYWSSIFLASLETVDMLCRATARRYRFDNDEIDELGSAVRLQLMEDDYAVLKKFEGRGTLKAYLTVVIRRTFLDRRIAQWGKWRPSRAARRHGDAGVLLERLTARDGLTFDEACDALKTNHGITASRSELRLIHESLAGISTRRFVDESQIADFPNPAASPFEELMRIEAVATTARAATALRHAVATLSAEDRSILELKYRRGISAADISRTLNVDQKRLYRRFEKVLAGLRMSLENQGFRRQDLLVGC